MVYRGGGLHRRGVNGFKKPAHDHTGGLSANGIEIRHFSSEHVVQLDSGGGEAVADPMGFSRVNTLIGGVCDDQDRLLSFVYNGSQVV